MIKIVRDMTSPYVLKSPNVATEITYSAVQTKVYFLKVLVYSRTDFIIHGVK